MDSLTDSVSSTDLFVENHGFSGKRLSKDEAMSIAGKSDSTLNLSGKSVTGNVNPFTIKTIPSAVKQENVFEYKSNGEAVDEQKIYDVSDCDSKALRTKIVSSPATKFETVIEYKRTEATMDEHKFDHLGGDNENTQAFPSSSTSCEIKKLCVGDDNHKPCGANEDNDGDANLISDFTCMCKYCDKPYKLKGCLTNHILQKHPFEEPVIIPYVKKQ